MEDDAAHAAAETPDLDLAALPDPVRRRVVAFAAEALAQLDDLDVPPSLRRLRSFTPAKRARLGATALLGGLAAEPALRLGVARWLRQARPALAAAASGEPTAESMPPEELPPAELAAAAALLGSPRAAQLSEEVRRSLSESTDPRALAAAERAAQRNEVLLGRVRRDLDQLQERTARAEQESAEARRRLRESERALRRLTTEREDRVKVRERELAALREEVAGLREQLGSARRERDQLANAREAERRTGRDERRQGDLRQRLLLDVLTAAARGLARELALPPGEGSPADLLAEELAAQLDPFAGVSDRALASSDLGLVDRILTLPRLHLMVDGYNVTKTGYPALSLEEQRARLLGRLAALAARTGAEVSCVFDAAERSAGTAAVAPRAPGVRVLFSPPGVIADDVLLRLVAAEPRGRPLLVATSDQEVATGARAAGARVLPSDVLLAWLGRV